MNRLALMNARITRTTSWGFSLSFLLVVPSPMWGNLKRSLARASTLKLGLSVLARANDLFKFPHIGLGTTNKKLKENPQEVVRVIRAFIKANRFIRDHRPEAISVLVDWGRTQKEDAVASYDSTWQVFSPDGSMPEDGMRL